MPGRYSVAGRGTAGRGDDCRPADCRTRRRQRRTCRLLLLGESELPMRNLNHTSFRSQLPRGHRCSYRVRTRLPASARHEMIGHCRGTKWVEPTVNAGLPVIFRYRRQVRLLRFLHRCGVLFTIDRLLLPLNRRVRHRLPEPFESIQQTGCRSVERSEHLEQTKWWQTSNSQPNTTAFLFREGAWGFLSSSVVLLGGKFVAAVLVGSSRWESWRGLQLVSAWALQSFKCFHF